MSDSFQVRLLSLKDKIKSFPSTSGVYLMKNQVEKIIYVGKAKNLRVRVRSYFSNLSELTPKTHFLVKNIFGIEFISTDTEVEAYLLEASLIKKHQPKYNIRLRDDKAYPYIRVSLSDSFPRLYLSRKVVKDGSMYFGPYTSGLMVRQTIRFINQIFFIRDCKDGFMAIRKRPCMTHQIGRCGAPCVGLVGKQEYRFYVDSAIEFLRGKEEKIADDLTKKMHQASQNEEFELAARLRDNIKSIQVLRERQSVIDSQMQHDRDVVGYHGGEQGTLIYTLHIRSGRVIGRRSHFIPLLNSQSQEEDPRDWLVSFLNQYYAENVVPDEILLPVDIGGDLKKLLEAVLYQRRGSNTEVRLATDVKGQDLIQLGNDNAKANFEEHVQKSKAKQRGLEIIQKKLKLNKRPSRIECYDISNFQGQETVASQVVFDEGVPSKEHYRRYKLRTISGANDFQSLAEVLSRRLAHKDEELPDLIVVDGGKGQLNAALKILSDLGFEHIPLVGLAKSRVQRDFKSSEVDSTEERFFLPGRQNPVIFSKNSDAFYILTGIRDEAHRFAINYHRKLREDSSLSSELDYVVGLGEKRKKILLKAFRSMDDIRSSNVEELTQLTGFNRVLAERILLQLQQSNET